MSGGRGPMAHGVDRGRGGREVWRPWLGRLVPHGLIPVVVASLAAVGYVMAPGVGPADMALFGLIGFIGLTLLYLAGRPRVVVHAGGLTVVNIFRRRELEWPEVVAASMPEGEPWPTFDLADGTTLAAMGIQAADGARARRDFARLQTLLDRYGHSDAHSP